MRSVPIHSLIQNMLDDEDSCYRLDCVSVFNQAQRERFSVTLKGKLHLEPHHLHKNTVFTDRSDCFHFSYAF